MGYYILALILAIVGIAISLYIIGKDKETKIFHQ